MLENPDLLAEKPKLAEKVGRKLERAGYADLAEAAPARKAMAAPAPAPAAERGDRSSRSERPPGRAERSPANGSEGRASAATPADPKFDAFRVIAERNIFNPNRVARLRERAEDRPPRVDTVALVGTMQYDQGVLAFFDSADPAYRKTLREGQSLGEFTVKRIDPDGVELTRKDQPIALKVAQQLVRPEGGEWSIAAAERRDDATAGDAERARTSTPAAPPAIPADASDVVRRMMEQRQKQLKQ